LPLSAVGARLDQASTPTHPIHVPASDIAVVRVLQDDLPLTPAPFETLARLANLSAEQLLTAAQRMQQAGQMRRLAAILHHRAAGFSANAMGVWIADDDRVEEVGRLLASFRAVSHCYQRPTWPDWPFNLFTMVHGHTPAECEAHLAAMREAAGISRMAVLYSQEEYKKIRLRFFTGDIEAWEAEKE
jgi:DNA-binding Lrp family transcriptional regulator